MHSAGGGERLGRVGSLPRIDRVGRAQADELGARGIEGGDHRVAVGKPVVGQSRDAAGLEEILGEVRVSYR